MTDDWKPGDVAVVTADNLVWPPRGDAVVLLKRRDNITYPNLWDIQWVKGGKIGALFETGMARP